MTTDLTKLEGAHETVAKTAKMLADNGALVSVRNGHTTKDLDQIDAVNINHQENYTVFTNHNDIAVCTINEDSTVFVRHTEEDE